MRHLILSRELPPAPYTPGGIGTYVGNISRLLAEHGETVHVIGQRWEGAPLEREELLQGRLIIHRIAPEDAPRAGLGEAAQARWRTEVESLCRSPFPHQWFGFQAALLAERLIEEEGIDVVEGQEWEAPLYYLLLRRELGLGPRRRPPCFVHLHSPSEFIARFDGLDPARPEVLTMKRMEDYCIKTADALLCPSHYLAQQCEVHYRRPAGSIEVIPLPRGEARYIEREARTWETGSICYMGRLEARKGVMEWVDAAVQVAARAPLVSFDFLGDDTWPMGAPMSIQTLLESRIPKSLRPRFRFHGAKPREELPRFLARAMAAVVPSRWENFPNTCLEAMSSGLPVIATRFGGMAEMIEDGVSGWLADSEDLSSMVPGLAAALERCLAATPAERLSMGREAATAMQRLCDNRRTVQQHVAFRARLARQANARVMSGGSPAARHERPPVLGVVVWVRTPAGVGPVLQTLRQQTRAPATVVVVAPPDFVQQALVDEVGGCCVTAEASCAGEAWNTGLAGAHPVPVPLGWVFLDQHDLLQPDALERLADALAAVPAAGFISCWTAVADRLERTHLPLNPELPHQWLSGVVAHATAFRTEVLRQPLPFGRDPGHGFDLWELTLRALAEGWRALTYPAVLARRTCDDLVLSWSAVSAFRERRGALLRRFPDVVAADAVSLIDLYAPAPAELPKVPPQPVGPLLRAWRTLRHPRRLAKTVAARLQRFASLSLARRLLTVTRDPRRLRAAIVRRVRRHSGHVPAPGGGETL